MSLFMKIHVHWNNQIIQNFQSLKILKERVVRQRIFLYNIWKIIMFNGFKMSSFRCRSHVQEIIFPRNMLVVQRNSFLDFFGIFCVYGYKQNINTHVKNHHFHMNYFKLHYSIILT